MPELKYGEYRCQYCDRIFSLVNSRTIHEKYCEDNPNKIPNPAKGKPGHKVSEYTKRKISETMKNNYNAGGLRHGSGRGHKGWYKNYFCDSTYELS